MFIITKQNLQSPHAHATILTQKVINKNPGIYVFVIDGLCGYVVVVFVPEEQTWLQNSEP